MKAIEQTWPDVIEQTWPDVMRHAGLSKMLTVPATWKTAETKVESLPIITNRKNLGGGAWEWTLRPRKGGTLFDVELEAEAIAAEYNAHRLFMVRDKPGIGRLIINTVDPFPPLIQWTPPKTNNRHFVTLGVTSAGESWGVQIGRAPHLLCAGTTNSGKSKVLVSLVASAACMDGVELWGIDPKELDLPPFADRFSELVIGDDPDEVTSFLRRAMTAMKERQAFMRSEGFANFDEWCDANGVEWCERFPFVELIIDEVQDVLGIPAEKGELSCLEMLVKLTRKARAVGMHVTVATQQPLAKQFPTELRGNFSSRWVGKTQGPRETEVAIGNADLAKRCPAHHFEELTGEAYFIGWSTRDGIWQQSSQPLHVKSRFLSTEECRRIAAATVECGQKPAPTLPGVPTVELVEPGPVERGYRVLPPFRGKWDRVKADGFPYPTKGGEAQEHRRAAWVIYGDSPACMECGVVCTWHRDSIRVATADGTRNLAERNLVLLCQECMGRARGAL